VLLLSL